MLHNPLHRLCRGAQLRCPRACPSLSRCSRSTAVRPAGAAGGDSAPAPNATLFSNLNPKTLQHEPGTVWGATALVAGTTVGAGILALPAVTQESGFAATSVTLLGCCAFAIATGLLIAEVNVNVLRRYGDPNVTFVTMAERTVGSGWAVASAAVYIFHNYALLVAYVARAGQIVSGAAHLPGLAGAAAFAVTVGGMCYATSSSQFDRINTALLALAAAAFVALLTIAGAEIDFPVLAKAEWSAVPPTIPIIALAFVYHNVVPVVVQNLEGDAAKIRSSIIMGVLIPAVMYLLWDGTILGSLDNLAAGAAERAAAATAAVAATAAAASASVAAAAADSAADSAAAVAAAGGGELEAVASTAAAAAAADAAAVAAASTAAVAVAAAEAADVPVAQSAAELTAALDPLVLLQRTGGPVVAPLVEVFSFLAITTSFTGFVLAAVDFLPDAFKPLAGSSRETRYALVVLPPILLSTASPGIFFASLDIAGTYGVMTLYGMMPAIMAWASRYNSSTAAAAAAASITSSSSAGAGQEVEGSSGGSSSGAAADAAGDVQLVPGGPAVLLLTGVAAASVIVSQWVL